MCGLQFCMKQMSCTKLVCLTQLWEDLQDWILDYTFLNCLVLSYCLCKWSEPRQKCVTHCKNLIYLLKIWTSICQRTLLIFVPRTESGHFFEQN